MFGTKIYKILHVEDVPALLFYLNLVVNLGVKRREFIEGKPKTKKGN